MSRPPVHLVTGHIRTFAYQYRIPLLAALVLLLVGLFVSQRQSEMAGIVLAMRSAHPFWIVVALAVNVIVVWAAGLTYRVILARLGHRLTWPCLTYLHLRRHVVGTVTPLGGPASIYVLVRSLGGRGVPSHDALFAVAIRSLAGYSAFVMILLPVVVFNRPSGYVLAGAVGIIALLGVLITAVSLLLRPTLNPRWLMSRLHPRLTGIIEQARSHRLRPVDLLPPLGLGVLHHTLGVLTLYLCLLAVGFQGALTTAIIGYAIGNLFTMIAPVFQGIGVVELTMSVALHQLGVPMPAAIAATLLFRFSDLWFPFLIGLGTHVSLNERVRPALSHIPAITAAAAGFIALLAPLLSGRSSRISSIPVEIMPAMAAITGAGCILMAYALWRKKPAGHITVYGAAALLAPLLVVQAGEIIGIGVPLGFLSLVMSSLIG